MTTKTPISHYAWLSFPMKYFRLPLKTTNCLGWWFFQRAQCLMLTWDLSLPLITSAPTCAQREKKKDFSHGSQIEIEYFPKCLGIHFLSTLIFEKGVKSSAVQKYQEDKDTDCLSLFLLNLWTVLVCVPMLLFFLTQLHLLILVVAQWLTATRLHPVPEMQPLGMSGVTATDSIWTEVHPPGDVTMKIYRSSLFFHNCLWNPSTSAAETSPLTGQGPVWYCLF